MRQVTRPSLLFVKHPTAEHCLMGGGFTFVYGDAESPADGIRVFVRERYFGVINQFSGDRHDKPNRKAFRAACQEWLANN